MTEQPVTIIIQSDPWIAFRVLGCAVCVIAAYLFGKWSGRRREGE